MICPNCKCEIADNSIFCVNCGCNIANSLRNSVEQMNYTQSEVGGGTASSGAALPVSENTAQTPQNNYNEYQQSAANGFAPANMGGNSQNTPDGNPMQNGVYPLPQQGCAPPAQPVKPKKSVKKALPFIIGGGAAAVVLAVICCVKFAAADIVHGFMGDEKYAASLTKNTVTALANNDYIEKSLTSSLSASLDNNSTDDYSQYEEFKENNPDSTLSYYEYSRIKSGSSVLSALGKQLPENGIYVKAGVKSEFTDKFYKLIAESTGADANEIKKVIESCNSFNAEGKFSVKEDGIDFGYLISDSGKDLDSGNIYYNTDDGILYYSNSAIYSSPIRTKLLPLDIDLSSDSDKTDYAKLAKEKNELVKKIVEIYGKHIKHAETEYTDVTESFGESEFKGKSMKVTFENEALAELLRDITNAVLDSDYFESVLETAYGGSIPDYLDIDDMKDDAEKAYDQLAESDGKNSVSIEHFLNADNSFAGLRLTASSKNGSSKNTREITFINSKSAFYAEVKADKTTYLKCEGKKFSNKSGTAEITVNIPEGYGSDTKKLKLTVEYSDLGQKELFGSKQILGNFNINISGNILDSLSSNNNGDGIDIASIIKKTTISVSAKDKGSGIEYVAELKNESYGNIGYTIEVGENTEPVSDRAGMTEESAVDISSGSVETVDVQIGALKHIQNICSDSQLMDFAFNQSVYDGNFGDEVQNQINQLENSKKYISVYKDYGSHTVYTANNNAGIIYYRLYSSNELQLPVKNKQPVTIKVYYDDSGKMNIVDMAGEEESLLSNITDLDFRNCFVEILYYKAYNKYSPLGVTVIMTDSKDHHCTDLPTVYNYIDTLYPWSGDDNYIDEYVVGAYPSLYQGTSTYEQQLKDLTDKAVKYNEYAEKGFNAFKAYLKNTNNSFNLSSDHSNSYAAFKIQSGTWSNFFSIDKYSFKNPLDTELLFNYMKTYGPDIKDGYLFIYVSDNTVVGASYSTESYLFSTANIIAGVTDTWGIAEGVNTYGEAVGTYPIVNSYDGTLSDKAKKLMVGTWINKYNQNDKLTITEDDLKYITEITSYTVEYVRIRFDYADGTSKTIYFNMAGKLEYNFDTYTKK